MAVVQLKKHTSAAGEQKANPCKGVEVIEIDDRLLSAHAKSLMAV